jgi:hypothetical protein
VSGRSSPRGTSGTSLQTRPTLTQTHEAEKAHAHVDDHDDSQPPEQKAYGLGRTFETFSCVLASHLLTMLVRSLQTNTETVHAT